MQGDINTASKVFYSGISMGWVNILVQTVIPDATAIGVGYSEIVSTLALACMLQVHTQNPYFQTGFIPQYSPQNALCRVCNGYPLACTPCRAMSSGTSQTPFR
jgi:hypothetical protein